MSRFIYLGRYSLLLVTVLSIFLSSAASTDLRAQESQQVVAPAAAEAIGNAFTYQGYLKDSGTPANGDYDFIFEAYSATSGGTSLGVPVYLSDISVVSGNFTVVLDFSQNIFGADLRYLQINVRPGASQGNYTTLQPRRPITPAPVAIFAQQARSLPMGTEITGSVEGHGLKVTQADYNSTTYRSALFGQNGTPTGEGVGGSSRHPTGINYGVRGTTDSYNGYGGAFVNLDKAGSGKGIGLYARGPGFAALLVGNVDIRGKLSKSSGSFKIDHPLDPTNKYLYHSFVESPDMMNIYNGNATLDEQGEVWITLPDWFGALNKEFRYQLTAIGGPGPNLYIAKTVENNRFQIAGGSPGLSVSWQVTGIRHDPYAEQNRIQVEEEKPADEQGTYLYPEVYGASKEQGLNYRKVEMFEPAESK